MERLRVVLSMLENEVTWCVGGYISYQGYNYKIVKIEGFSKDSVKVIVENKRKVRV